MKFKLTFTVVDKGLKASGDSLALSAETLSNLHNILETPRGLHLNSVRYQPTLPLESGSTNRQSGDEVIWYNCLRWTGH